MNDFEALVDIAEYVNAEFEVDDTNTLDLVIAIKAEFDVLCVLVADLQVLRRLDRQHLNAIAKYVGVDHKSYPDNETLTNVILERIEGLKKHGE